MLLIPRSFYHIDTFPIVFDTNQSQLRQSFRVFNSTINRTFLLDETFHPYVISDPKQTLQLNYASPLNHNAKSQLNQNLNATLKPEQYDIAPEKQPIHSKAFTSCSSVNNSYLWENCTEHDLIVRKKNNLFEFHRRNITDTKFFNNVNELSLRELRLSAIRALIDSKARSGDQLLTSLVQDAADLTNLFDKMRNRERALPAIIQQNIRRKQAFQQAQPLQLLFSGDKNGLSVQPLKFSQSLGEKFRSQNISGNLKTQQYAHWENLLFGPDGVLTAVFHILDGRRKIPEKSTIKNAVITSKIGTDKSQAADSYQQTDLIFLPDFLVNASGVRTHEDLRPLELKSNALTTRPSLSTSDLCTTNY
ncbi:unnamed protein product [Thelazia callipaeda]|uniref:Uncharacterized protein n=1 Tax=Thelazia callipaeda TaxID=103827 RepID=A0A0N5CN14_THECL|nr:unnamed protein product [Thelazia callipaeda]